MINSARHVLPLAVVAAAALGITGCTVASAPTAEAEASAAPTTASPLAPTASPLPAEVATSDLGAQLRYLIEEEKLAHDVYTVLGDLWGGNVFVNIAASETTHQDAVAALLAEHAIVDPRADEVGVFSDPDLQALYDQLVADGSQSRAAAIDVGVLIEQTDIADLTRALDGADDDVAVVLERLLAGSQNHLTAFERQA